MSEVLGRALWIVEHYGVAAHKRVADCADGSKAICAAAAASWRRNVDDDKSSRVRSAARREVAGGVRVEVVFG